MSGTGTRPPLLDGAGPRLKGLGLMGCLLAVVAALSPRLALVLVWIFTNLVDRAFTGFLLPLLGLIFLPFTTLLYVLAYRPVVGVSGWGWLFVFLGLLFDLGAYGAGARSRRR